MERKGDWIQTNIGVKFYPLDPRPEEIFISDIAHSLSMKCRYGGHSKTFYSVAEHSVLISRELPIEYAMWGLLHDASEAYSADIPAPLKRFMPDFIGIEHNIMKAVCEKFNLPYEEPKMVKEYDTRILMDEKAVLFDTNLKWNLDVKPLDVHINSWDPKTAKNEFLKRFEELNSYKGKENQ